MQGGSGSGGSGGKVDSNAFLVAGLAAGAGLAGLYFYLSSQFN